MDTIAQAPSTERVNLFRQAAAILRPERSPAIIEKDFWVCWSLHRIYDVLQLRPQVIFKGGTQISEVSLSCVHSRKPLQLLDDCS